MGAELLARKIFALAAGLISRPLRVTPLRVHSTISSYPGQLNMVSTLSILYAVHAPIMNHKQNKDQ